MRNSSNPEGLNPSTSLLYYMAGNSQPKRRESYLSRLTTALNPELPQDSVRNYRKGFQYSRKSVVRAAWGHISTSRDCEATDV